MPEHTNPTSTEWTAERIAALGVVTDLPTAAAILQLSRSNAYELAKAGQFPVSVLRAGTRYRVPVAALLDALHLQPQIEDASIARTLNHARTAEPGTPGPSRGEPRRHSNGPSTSDGSVVPARPSTPQRLQ